ncbi:MAG: hypothetical protein GY772_09640 [bacterium]|nr:hypothetical protein [bacterium]
MQRPWDKDEFIKRVFQESVQGKHSIVQKIENSHILRQWFQTYQTQLSQDCPKCSNLRAAKHRFEQFSKPTGRLIIHMKAVFATANKLVTIRGPEENTMRRWLSTVSSEELLQLAMCADAADETMLLLRVFDSEQMDIATRFGNIERFLQRVTSLFNHGQCLVTMGYTRHCKDILESGDLLVYTEHGPRNVGLNLASSVINRCLSRMRCWTELVHDVLAAEFPDFDSVNAFSIFDLCEQEKQGAPASEPGNSAAQRGTSGNLATATALARLALIFGVAPGGLTEEFERMKTVAQTMKAKTECDNKAAWLEAWRRTQGSCPETQLRYHSENLGPVLLRCC